MNGWDLFTWAAAIGLGVGSIALTLAFFRDVGALVARLRRREGGGVGPAGPTG